MLGVLAGALVVLMALSTGCGGDGDGPESEEARESAVYAAVIRDVALTLPVTGEDPSETMVFVEPLDPESEIGLEVQASVVLELEDLVDVSFIDDREAAVDEDEVGEPVRDGTALIALGPVPEGRRRVAVDVERYERVGATERLRYLLERVGDEWQVAARSRTPS